MEITGKIIQALPLQTGVGRNGNWQLQTYILETFDNYPRKVAIELFNRNVDQNKCNIDDIVTVSFDLESREFNGRWYTSVRAWRIDPATQPGQPGMMPAAPAPQPAPTANQQTAQPAQQPTIPTAQAPSTQTFTAEPEDNSDMPF